MPSDPVALTTAVPYHVNDMPSDPVAVPYDVRPSDPVAVPYNFEIVDRKL